MNSTIQFLPIAAIKADERLQMRIALNAEHVDDIAAALSDDKLFLDPPPVVFQCDSDYWLADGYHRLAAHKKAGLEEMRCEVRTGQFRDALLFALGANQHTSLKRTNADKRKAVETALGDAEIAALSNRQIAELCGVSGAFVDTVRNESTANGWQSTQRLGRNGRTIDTANIGKNPRSRGSSDAHSDESPSVVEAPTDPFGRPLAGDLVGVFEDRKAILSKAAELTSLSDQVKKLCELRGGRFIALSTIEHHLRAAQRLLEAASPQAVCPECGDDSKRQAICRTCDGNGFVAAHRFKELAPMLQKKAVAF